MIATSRMGSAKLASMPVIATSAIDISIAFSEGQCGLHYQGSVGGGQCRRQWEYTLDAGCWPCGFAALDEIAARRVE
jgi:hypothetical protein